MSKKAKDRWESVKGEKIYWLMCLWTRKIRFGRWGETNLGELRVGDKGLEALNALSQNLDLNLNSPTNRYHRGMSPSWIGRLLGWVTTWHLQVFLEFDLGWVWFKFGWLSWSKVDFWGSMPNLWNNCVLHFWCLTRVILTSKNHGWFFGLFLKTLQELPKCVFKFWITSPHLFNIQITQKKLMTLFSPQRSLIQVVRSIYVQTI